MWNLLITQGFYKLFGGLYLGWGIGANDAANIFGTAVATNSVRFRTAVILIAIFVVLGAVIEGPELYERMKFTHEEPREAAPEETGEAPPGGIIARAETAALLATLAAALTVTLITYLAIPTSTSQAAVGAFMGIALAQVGPGGVDWANFRYMAVAWLMNPIASLILAIALLRVMGWFFNRFIKNPIVRDRIFQYGLIIVGCYGAYALGANNVVVSTAPYYHAGMFGPRGLTAARWAAAAGGVSIAIGALTYSKRVMVTLGKKITTLSPFTALVVVLTHSLSLHFFTLLEVPVSSSQAVVGALIGVGLYRGTRMVNVRTLKRIFIGWLATPVVAALLAFLMVSFIFKLAS